jgi:hypothetical protein
MLGFRIGRFPDKHGVSPGPSQAGTYVLYVSKKTMGKVQGHFKVGLKIGLIHINMGKSRALSSWGPVLDASQTNMG